MLVIGFLSLMVIDWLIIEIFQVFEDLNGVEAIVLLVLAWEGKWVASHFEYFKLVPAFFKIQDWFLVTSYKVLPKRENIQIRKLLHAAQD